MIEKNVKDVVFEVIYWYSFYDFYLNYLNFISINVFVLKKNK